MPPPMNKFRFYTNILVSTLLSILLLLIILHFAGYLAQLEGGVYVGFGTALLAWTATIIAILADASIVMMFVLHGHSISVLRLYKKYRPLFIAFPFAFAALILILQFGTPYLRYVEAGISDGIAPPILLGIAPLLSMLAIVGLILYSWKTKLLSRSIAVGEQKAGEINQPKQVQEDLSSKEAAKGQLEMISSLLDKSEMQKLVGAEWGYDESRDRLQTKKNIETWILESVKAANRVSKSRLEAEFKRQFPTAYLALFNSVLYDLVYRDKLEVIREEGKTMICLHGADRKQNGKTAKF
jgi:hypothetical protein